jgi:hypothetical protein
MRISHFNQAELAFRWRISPRTVNAGVNLQRLAGVKVQHGCKQ